MSDYDDTAPLLEWLRQPRWMEGAKQRRLFEAADEIERGKTMDMATKAHIERLEAALKSIAANTCCDNCQEAARVARAALASYVGLATELGSNQQQQD